MAQFTMTWHSWIESYVLRVLSGQEKQEHVIMWHAWKAHVKQLLKVVSTFLNRKNSGVQTAPKSRATSCNCSQAISTR
jgi:hypothetical protein